MFPLPPGAKLVSGAPSDTIKLPPGATLVTAPPADEPSPVSKSSSAFWEGIGGKAALDLLGGASRDPQRVEKALQTVKALAGGIAAEPGRVWDALTHTAQSIGQGDDLGMRYHLATAVPFFGGAVQQITTEAGTGKPAEAVGHTAALVLPFAAKPLAASIAPALERAAAVVGEIPEARAAVASRVQAVGRPPVAEPGAVSDLLGRVAAYKTAGVLPKGVTAAGVGRVVSALKNTVADEAEALRIAKIWSERPDVERPAPLWQQTPPAADVAMPAELPDVSAQVQAAAEEMKARALARQAPPGPPTPQQVLGVSLDDFSQSLAGKPYRNLPATDQARVLDLYQRAAQQAEVFQGPRTRPAPVPMPAQTVAPEPQPAIIPESQPAVTAPEPPAAAPVAPAAIDRNPTAAQIAADLENSMRVDRLTDYLRANKIPPQMVAQFGPDEWRLVAGSAKTGEPTAAQVAEIRQSYEVPTTIESPSNVPAAAQEQFQQARTRAKRPKVEPITKPVLKPGQTPAEALAEMMPESVLPPPAEAAAPTASEIRVQALAQHLADSDIPTAHLAAMPDNPNALDQLARLGRALGIEGAPAAGEVPQIIDAVRKLRFEKGEPSTGRWPDVSGIRAVEHPQPGGVSVLSIPQSTGELPEGTATLSPAQAREAFQKAKARRRRPPER